MCGIAGGVSLDGVSRPDEDRVQRMTALLTHRGPDESGTWSAASGLVVLGHRRLSIIDLAGGKEPMVLADDRQALTFNGEIYNYLELREQLIRNGVSFDTSSDTEVLLRLWDARGPESLSLLRGMFAFGVWDSAQRTLHLVRDRLGKKPLFYQVEEHCLYFASTLPALAKTTSQSLECDLTAVDDFLELGYVPAPRTMYRQIRRLSAGARLEVVPGGDLQETQYWQLEPNGDIPSTYTEAQERLDLLLHESVRIRLRSDVPLGVFLSGGVDSSLVTAIACRYVDHPIQTFAIGFEGGHGDERSYAAQVAAHLGTSHHQQVMQPHLASGIEEMLGYYGEPFGDPAVLPLRQLAAFARKSVTVALGGDGGDEGFAGYPWYPRALQVNRLSRFVPAPLAELVATAVPGGTGGALRRIRRGLDQLAMGDAAEQYADLRCLFGPSEVESVYQGALVEARRDHTSQARALIADRYRTGGGTPLDRMRRVDVSTYLADCLLPKLDIATMACGLEARAPLLDHELLAFALSLPPAWLSSNGRDKRILRDALARYLPMSLIERPKQGFVVPLQSWFRRELRAEISALARSSRLVATGWFQPDGLSRLIEEHQDGRRDHSDRLFNLLVLDRWLPT